MIFELRIGASEEPGAFRVEVVRSEGGGTPEGKLVLDVSSILSRRGELENAVLASAVQGRGGRVSAVEAPLREVGQQLFEALFKEQRVYGAYRTSMGAVQKRHEQLQVMLQVTAPDLAALPWEALYDPETGAYLCLNEPLIRCVEAPYTRGPLRVKPPLHILGLVASPRGLPALDVEAEKQRLEEALAKPRSQGRVDLTWAPDASWETIHDLMLNGTWHILHFIGHGGFDVGADEGYLVLVDQDGRADPVEASRLANLLCDAKPIPGLVVLNSCSSGETGSSDLFSGTAAMLVHRGVGAAAAMQFRISDTAAINFSRGFYTAIATGRPIDLALRSGRVGIRGLEWITPVLYVRAGLTQLFTLPKQRATGAAPPEPTSSKESPARSEPPNGQLDQGVAASSVKTTHGEGAAAVGQQALARPGGRRRFGILRSLSRARMTGLAVAALVIAIAGVIMAHYLLFGSRPGWPYDTGSAVYAQPVIGNGVIYVGSTSGYLYALDGDTGTVRWQFPQAGHPAIGSIYSSPGVAGDTVYVGSGNGRVYALKSTTGVPVWSQPCFKPGDGVRSSPVVVDGVVYATSGSGYVCALRAASGARYWKTPVWIRPGAPGFSPTVPANIPPGTGLNRISIFVGSGDGHVYALNAGSGAKSWEFPPKGKPGVGIIDSQPAMSSDGSTVYAASSGSGGHLYALNADTGKEQWEYPRNNKPGIGTVDSQPAVANDGSAVYVASGFYVYALNPSSGTPLATWTHDPVHLPSTMDTAGPELGTVALYVGSGNHAECLNATSGAFCWEPPFTADSRVVSPPTVDPSNGTIYFGTLHGKVYALTPSGAQVCAAYGRSCG